MITLTDGQTSSVIREADIKTTRTETTNRVTTVKKTDGSNA